MSEPMSEVSKAQGLGTQVEGSGSGGWGVEGWGSGSSFGSGVAGFGFRVSG